MQAVRAPEHRSSCRADPPPLRRTAIALAEAVRSTRHGRPEGLHYNGFFTRSDGRHYGDCLHCVVRTFRSAHMAGLTAFAKATAVRRPASAKATAVRRSFSEGGSFMRRRKVRTTSGAIFHRL